MKNIFVLLIKVFKALFGSIAGFLTLFGILYIVPPKYIFPEKKPFSGDKFYNPYEKTGNNPWLPANFHMHTHAWGGITDGAVNRDHLVWAVYSRVGFKSIAISNYQSINTFHSTEPFYIPAYEHGYGFYKNHHLCLGAKRVDWFDLPYGQTIHHKQYILNRLRKSTELISINHPSFFGGYKPGDFIELTGYDFIEVLNGFRNSVPHWDSALSAGRPAFILANDDMHDITNFREIGRRFTLINAPSTQKKDIFSALKKGAAIGVYYKTPENQSLYSKAEILHNLPKLESVQMHNDTLTVEMDSTALEIRFFGQGGKMLYKHAHTRIASCPVRPEDSYIRTVVLYDTPEEKEGLQYYLNPVFRTPDGIKPAMPGVSVDTLATIIYRLVIALILLISLILLIFIWRKVKKNRRRKRLKTNKYR